MFWPPNWPRRHAATLCTSVALWILVCFGHQVGPEGMLPHFVQAWHYGFWCVLATKLAQKACCHTLYKRGTMDFGVFWPPSWPRRHAATLCTSVALWILVCFGHQVGPEGLLPHLVQAWHYGFWGGLDTH